MRIQIKRDISDNWNSNNPILKSGEFGYDITNNIVKIGDGVTTWKNLSCCNYDDFINKAKSYTDSVIENLIGEAPSTLDTIYEIAQAIQNNQSIIESLNQSIANKVDKVSGKGLSTNDFSNDMKNKLSTAYDHSQKTSGNPHKVTKSDVGLANVDNTSDANKPVSTAQATAIADAKKAGTDAQSSVQTLKTEVNNNTNAISEIEANITTNIYNLNDVVKGKWIMDKNGSTGDSTSWAYLPLKVKGLKTVTISALGGTASWNKHYFNDSNGTTIDYNNSQVTVSVPSDATILYVNIYEEFTDINAIKITTESVGEVVTDINASLSVLGKCKNLLKTTLGSGNGNGITYINNGDGTYTLNGTCTNTFELHFNQFLKLPYGKYKLLGSSAFQKDNNGAWKATLASGDVFEVSESKPVLDVIAYITSGSVVDKTFKPMVTANLNATEDDFVPYTGDGDTLTADMAKLSSNINSSMSDYGMNNVFDGEFIQGSVNDDGSFNTDTLYLRSNKIACTSGDLINVYYGKTVWRIHFYFVNSSGEVVEHYTGNSNISKDSRTAPSNATGVYVVIHNASATTPSQANRLSVYINNQIDILENSKAPTNHTHSYAGSSSVGGAATSANKLNTNAGNATSPVYFENGVPKACTYTLSKSVPSDAKFTDTWRGIQDNLTSDSTTESLSAKQGKVLLGYVDENCLKKPQTLVHTYEGSIAINYIEKSTGSSYAPSNTLDVTSVLPSNFNKVLAIRILPGNYKAYNEDEIFVRSNSGSKTNFIIEPQFRGDISSMNPFVINYVIYYTLNSGYGGYSNITTNDHTHDYLPLSGGTIDGKLNVKNMLSVNGFTSINNSLVSTGLTVSGEAKIKTDIIIVDSGDYGLKKYVKLNESSLQLVNLISSSSSTDIVYHSDTHGTEGTVVGNNYRNTKVKGSSYIYFQADTGISSSLGWFQLSDEKIKSFTDDIEIDKDKIVKLFDLINIKSYTRKDAKPSNKDVLNIGVSAQELEESILEVGLDNERYNIIDNHYDYMMDRGDDEEDSKFYPRFMTVNYDSLYTLSLIKIRVIEETHNIKLRELEERISKLENN